MIWCQSLHVYLITLLVDNKIELLIHKSNQLVTVKKIMINLINDK